MTQARCAVPEMRFGYDSCGLVDVILLDAQELPEGSANLIVYDWDTRQIAAFLPLETLSHQRFYVDPAHTYGLFLTHNGAADSAAVRLEVSLG